jgi:hypothetical protein
MHGTTMREKKEFSVAIVLLNIQSVNTWRGAGIV